MGRCIMEKGFAIWCPVLLKYLTQTYLLLMLIDRDMTVVAAGAIYRGSSLAPVVMMGAQSIWTGMRFSLANKVVAPVAH